MSEHTYVVARDNRTARMVVRELATAEKAETLANYVPLGVSEAERRLGRVGSHARVILVEVALSKMTMEILHTFGADIQWKELS